MKKDLILAAALMLSAIALPSCSNDEDEISQATDSKDGQVTFSASATMKCGDKGLSKAALRSDMKIYFSPNQTAAVKFLNGTNILDMETFTADNTSMAAATTNFSGSVKTSALENATAITATLPASAVDSDGNIVIPTTQTPEICGFDPAAFIATGSVDKPTMTATFTADVALLKITAKGSSDLTISGKGIAGTKGNSDKITVTGMKSGKIYYVAVNPGTYSTITFAYGDDVLKTITSATLEKGYYYTALTYGTTTITTLTFYNHIPSSTTSNPSSPVATRIVFDFYNDYDLATMDGYIAITDDVKAYYKGNEYFVLSDKTICFSGATIVNVSGWKFLFDNNTNLTSIEFNNFNTDGLTSAWSWFEGLTSLKNVDMSGLNMENCSSFESTFKNCTSLESVNMEGLKTNITGMFRTFLNCSKLKSIDLSGWNTSNLTNMNEAFSGCTSLETIYVSDLFYTGNVTRYSNIFNGCTSLVGGQGTVFDSSNKDNLDYARIDDPDNGKPGYFTGK